MPRMRSRRKHRRRNQNRAPKPEDPEFSDDDNDIILNDDTGLYMVLPRRSGILGKLPIHLLDLLSGQDRSAFINQSQAKRCLGEERFKLVLKTDRMDKKFLLTDFLGTVHISWTTKRLPAKFFSKNSTRLMAAAGHIRHQGNHPLCWDFSLCDLVSASAVIHGQMEKYEPLSHMYLCQNVQKESYRRRFVGDGKTHSCYPCSIYDGFKFVMASGGIPKANVMEMKKKFDCNLRRQDIPGEERFGITDVYRYETLEQALWRLETHPVAASLICFDGWDDPGVYIGPKEGAKYAGEHEVLMIDCIEVEDKMIIRCKSSNGEDSANGGYIYVSVEVMLITVGGARKKDGQYTCLKKPQHLLYDFYSVDMTMGPYPAQFDEDESRKELNNKFRVNFGMSCGSGIPHSSVSLYSRESASQPAKTNSAMDADYNWAIAISDRAKKSGRTKEAEELWEQVTNNYEKAVQLNLNSSQALNNWGLALQELSKIVPAREKEKVVRTAISKFRAAIRLQFDFHLAIYNLGTVLYGLAEDTLRTRGSDNGIDMPPSELYSQSAIYIAAAHSLKPSYSVYSSALRLVRSMLPLPYLKVGYLTAPPVGNLLAPHSDWKRTEFELNHERLLQVLKPEPREMGRNLSGKSEAMNTNVEKKTVKVNITEIVSVTPCADLTLPPGAGLCIDTIHGPVFLVADSWESLDGWFDAIRLVYTIYARGKSDVLAGIITA